MTNYHRAYERFINCDFCGAMTRGRIYETEPDVTRCGSCSYPLSEGTFYGKTKEACKRKLSDDTALGEVRVMLKEVRP